MDHFVMELKKVNKSYGKGESLVFALRDVDFQVLGGRMIAVMGASGSGKSTLLNVLGLLDTKDDGSYTLLGEDTDRMSERNKASLRNHKIGFVVQDFALIEQYTVAQNVAIPLEYSGIRWKRREKEEKILATLAQLGIENKFPVYTHALSGGQRQRVAIARAVVNDPAIILADEPTGELDSKLTVQIMDVFRQICKTGKTIIIATHNPVVAELCDTTYMMTDGVLEIRG
jgi:putative ABC transport system ATP-binding protein